MCVLFHRLEWQDWIAYALPSANIIHQGIFVLPQLGSQYGMEKDGYFQRRSWE